MDLIDLSSKKILITGGHGLVGKTLCKTMHKLGVQFFAPSHQECNLENEQETLAFFERLRPQLVFHLAAKVGGIQANMSDPVGFLESNCRITLNTFKACHRVGVQKVTQLNSACIYPRESPQPIKEEYLFSGPFEPTNEAYAIAKVMSLRLGQSYTKQFQMPVVTPIAAGIYGPGDSFDLNHSHVLSALVKRMVDARQANIPEVTLWGSGSPRRQFIHVQDVADALIFFMTSVQSSEAINLGPREDISIRELAEIIASEVGYTGKIQWDTTRPDGMPRKCLDVTQLEHLGFKTTISLSQGIKDVISDYRSHHAT